MQKLGMTITPDERNFMLQTACRKLDGKTHAYLAELQGKPELSMVDWARVESHIVKKEVEFEIQDPDKAAWLLVLNLERAYYFAQFEEGTLGSDAFAVLESFMANLAASAASVQASQLGVLYDKSFARDLINKMKQNHFKAALSYEIGLAYLAAQHEVKHLLEHASSEDGEEYNNKADQGARMTTGVAQRRRSLHGLALVAQEHEDNEIVMKEALKEVQLRKPDAVAHFQTHYATCMVLHKQEKLIHHMLHEGELIDLDAGPLSAQVDVRLKELYVEPITDKIAEIERAITRTDRRTRATKASGMRASPAPTQLHGDYSNSPESSPGNPRQKPLSKHKSAAQLTGSLDALEV
jgi:hypothetical protein